MIPLVGQRVRMVGVMPNDPCPMEVGAEGVVTQIGGEIQGRRQIMVEWENGRSLILLDTDPFVVVEPPRFCGTCGQEIPQNPVEGGSG